MKLSLCACVCILILSECSTVRRIETPCQEGVWVVEGVESVKDPGVMELPENGAMSFLGSEFWYTSQGKRFDFFTKDSVRFIFDPSIPPLVLEYQVQNDSILFSYSGRGVENSFAIRASCDVTTAAWLVDDVCRVTLTRD